MYPVTTDGHPNAAGYEAIASAITKALLPCLAEQESPAVARLFRDSQTPDDPRVLARPQSLAAMAASGLRSRIAR